MLRAVIPSIVAVFMTALAACGDSHPSEKEIIGAWSWTYIEGVGRMLFSADHKVKEGFPPEDWDGHRTLSDDQFTYLESGTWRLEGDVLVTDMDNKLLVDMYSAESRHKPELRREVRRQTIVKIDNKQMVFAEGGSLDRVHP